MRNNKNYISLITHSKAQGGANIAANRISNNLKKKFKIENIYCDKSNIFKNLKYILARFLVKIFIKNENFLNSLNLFSRVNILKAKGKVLFLNWIGEETVSLDDLIKINKPIIWTAHDLWPFTATEHFINNSNKNYYLEEDCKNNFLKSFIFRKKKKLFKKKNIILITNSKWLYNFSKKSTLTKRATIHQIYNPIETKIWKEIDTKKARSNLNLNTKKNYILIGAHGGIKNFRKGSDLFINSLEYLKDFKDNFDIIVLGNDTNKIEFINGYRFHFRKFTLSKNEQISFHSAANLTVSPSRGESIPQFIVETLLCGNPVVSFDIGGMNEVIKHKVNGFLAKPFNIYDFAKGAKYCLEKISKKNINLQRRKLIKVFDEKTNLKKYSNVLSNLNHK